MSAVSNHLPVFRMLWHNFQEDPFCDLTRHGVEANLLVDSGSSLPSFLEMGVIFPFLPSLRPSPACRDFSNVMDSGLATTSASYFRIHEFISSGPMDLCTFRFLNWSQTWSSPTVGGSSFFQSLTLPSVAQSMRMELLTVRTEAKKKVFKYLSLLHIQNVLVVSRIFT